jgi:AP-1 complex subunit gamma-1
LLGYPTAFGQVECIKLVSAGSYTEKRIGYLGLSQLLDESSEILMLVTSSIQKDLSAKENYIVALGLTAIAEVSTADMCRELYPTVKKLMSSNSPYIRQRACLATIRIIRSIPDCIEDFLEVIEACIKDSHQSVQMACITLCNEICKTEPSIVKKFKKHVGQLIKTLKSLLMSGYAPEYEIGGVKDPFLQVKILELMGRIGAKNSDASDEMSDILA